MPTRLGWNFLLLLGGIAFAALNTGNNLLYLLLAICLAVLVVSFVSAGSALARLRPEVTFPEEILAAEATAFVLTLHNLHPRQPSPAVVAEMQAGGLDLPAMPLAPVGPGAAATRFLAARFAVRGLYRTGRLTLRTADPLGLVHRRRHLWPQGEFFVYPAPQVAEPRDEDVRHERGDIPARRVGEGLDLHQIRAYQFDDDSRHIDWRASARVGDLMIKEFLDEGAEHLVIVFDPGVDRHDAQTRARFEQQVSLASWLVFRCLDRRTPFHFVAPDCEFLEIDPPGGHRPVLEYLATVQPVARPQAGRFAAELEGTPGLVRLGVGA